MLISLIAKQLVHPLAMIPKLFIASQILFLFLGSDKQRLITHGLDHGTPDPGLILSNCLSKS